MLEGADRASYANRDGKNEALTWFQCRRAIDSTSPQHGLPLIVDQDSEIT